VIADRSAQCRIPRFEGIKHSAHCGRTCDLKLHVTVHSSEVSQMKWKDDADHL